jgi:hypothetical protein
MANPDNPTGFSFTSLNNPNPPDTKTYVKLVGVGTAIFQQDLVFHAASSSLSEGKGAITPLGTPGSTVIMGVALNRGAASLKTRHSVIVDPRAEFIAQDDGDTNGVDVTQANFNGNASLGAGDATTGYSGHEIDEGTLAVTATLDFQLIGLAPIAKGDNAFGTSHVRMILKFHNARFQGASVGL